MAIREARQAHERERFVHALLTLRAPDVAHLQPELDVLRHRHVREQRVVLEHDAEPALGGRDREQVAPLERDATRGRLDEARDHLQRGCLAAARRSEQRDELALVDGERDVVDRRVVAVALGQPFEDKKGHLARGNPPWLNARFRA
jgi:hypothetical protein